MPLKSSSLHRSTAELLACAALQLFPTAKLVGGGTTDLGFYYEFAFPQTFDQQALVLLDETLVRLVKTRRPIKATEMMRENAVTLFEHLGQELLAERIATAPNNIVGIFQVGEYRGYAPPPYVENTADIGGCKLLGFSSQKQSNDLEITRIEGVAFEKAKALKQFVKRYETAKKVDHKTLGPELELFCQQPGRAAGCWTWLPKGTLLRQLLLDFWRQEHEKQGFGFVTTPKIMDCDPKKSLAFEVEGHKYTLTQETLASHVALFQHQSRSYRELPLRLAEAAELFAPIPSKELSGLYRTRTSTKDTAHIFCSEEDLAGEVISSLQFIRKTINMFRVESKWYLVSQKPKSAKKHEDEVRSVKLLAAGAKEIGLEYEVDEGERETSGPAIEGRLVDPLGREWPGPRLSICAGKREQACYYNGRDGQQRKAIVMARSLFGSLERFVAALVESLGGVFPLWLAPEQVRIIPVNEKYQDYADQVRQQLPGVRVTIDRGSDPLAAKVYAAKRTKVPYALVVGDSEQHNGTIAISPFHGKGKGRTESPQAFLKTLQAEMAQSPFASPDGTQFGDMRPFENK